MKNLILLIVDNLKLVIRIFDTVFISLIKLLGDRRVWMQAMRFFMVVLIQGFIKYESRGGNILSILNVIFEVMRLSYHMLLCINI